MTGYAPLLSVGDIRYALNWLRLQLPVMVGKRFAEGDSFYYSS